LAPGGTYPTSIHQVNDALAYIQQNAARFHLDPDRVVLAGDSAGAQITSQIAALVTNPAYAAELRLTPSLAPPQLRGAILFCGIYDMRAFLANDHLPGNGGLMARLTRWGADEAMWAYTGSRDHDSATLRQMSSIDHATAAFPPTFMSGGNEDPLTDAQSRPLSAMLAGLGIEVTTLFYPPDHQPGLAHAYQFDLDNADGQNALAQMLRFLKQYTSREAPTPGAIGP
jgi:acetyl esterase/lipase